MQLGIEGETHVKNDDGSYSFTEFVTKNPDGLSGGSGVCIMLSMMSMIGSFLLQRGFAGGASLLEICVQYKLPFFC